MFMLKSTLPDGSGLRISVRRRVGPRTKLPLPVVASIKPVRRAYVEGARDRGEVDVKVLGQGTLRGQAHTWRKTASTEVLGQRLHDGEVLRTSIACDCRFQDSIIDPSSHMMYAYTNHTDKARCSFVWNSPLKQ